MLPGSAGQDLERDASGRPTAPLRERHLLLLSIYWLGIAGIFSGLGALLQGRLEFEHLVTRGTEGSALLQMTAIGSFLALLVQPTIGTISDYTSSRWGRRRPYIVMGALLDLAFLGGIALSSTVISIAAFYLLLQLSSNTAQGPYQGYVPDMVPARQVGRASALVGLMQILGNVLGYGIGAIGTGTGQFAIATMALGGLETATMLLLVVGVREPAARRPREGRSWLAIARSAWGLDVLRERSFMWLVASRLLVLMGSTVVINLALFYLVRVFALGQQEAGTMQVAMVATVGAANALAILPAARASDRVGRKPMIYLACALGFTGLLTMAVAPGLPVAFVGVAALGVASGTFLAVDWALLTELVPKVSSGRYMGLSNVATASAGVLATGLGGTLMDVVGGAARDPSGPRAAMAFGAGCFVVGALLLRPVREPGR